MVGYISSTYATFHTYQVENRLSVIYTYGFIAPAPKSHISSGDIVG